MAYTPYEKREWINEETPLNADNLNHIENGIKNLEGEFTVDDTVLSLFAADGWVTPE